MQLIQKAYPFIKWEFRIHSDMMLVTTKTLLTSNASEVPLRDLSCHVSYYRHFPLPWIFTSIVLLLSGLTLLFVVFHNNGRDMTGLTIAILATLICGTLSLHGFFKRRVDYVIFHVESNGRPIIYLHRRAPSETYVREFVDIVKEHIKDAKMNKG